MYTDLGAALDRAKERCQRETAANDEYLEELLVMSAGVVPSLTGAGVRHYRPFWVAARFIAQDPDIRDISEASGEAKFTLAQPRIDELMASQAAYDAAYGLIVPPGMQAVIDSDHDGIAANARRYVAGTSSIPTTAVF
jgi:hypothetical protein